MVMLYNAPADVNSTVNMLPSGTIKVQLKRRLQYKSTALSLNVRPHKVLQAGAWLANTSALLINQNWNANFDEQVENLDAELIHQQLK